MPATKLTLDQRKHLLATGASVAEIQVYVEEGYGFADILDLCETARDTKAAQAKAIVREEAEAHALAEKQQRDHDKIDQPHSGVSHYNPAGGVLPKLHVKEFFWIGDPLHTSSTLSAAEIEKLNQIRPGEYAVTKTDGSTRIVKVFGWRSPVTQVWERMEVSFPVSGHEKHSWPSLIQICDQILQQQTALVTA